MSSEFERELMIIYERSSPERRAAAIEDQKARREGKRRESSELAGIDWTRQEIIDFGEFVAKTEQIWVRFARYLCRRWRTPLGVDQVDVQQELLFAGWNAVLCWDPGRGVTIDRYVRFQAIDKAKKWLHKQRDSYRRDGSAPSRAPTVFSAFERQDDEPGSAQDRIAWVPPEDAEEVIRVHDMRRELTRAFGPIAARLPYRERECLAVVARAGGSIDAAADTIISDPKLCLALRIGSGDEAVQVVRRTVSKAIELINNGGAQ